MSCELLKTKDGLTLKSGNLSLTPDFNKLRHRIDKYKLNSELLIRAARFKNRNFPITVADATAGLGEDSFLLAAFGFNVVLFEKNKIIYELLIDSIIRAKKSDDNLVSDAASRMHAVNTDSITGLSGSFDLIYLDPMFPAREKSGLVKKKFQLLKMLELPESNEEALFSAALKANPSKIVVKRPINAPYLSYKKPSHIINGKIIRFDVYQ